VATVIPPPCPCIAATVRNESRVTVAALRARMVSPSGIDIHKAVDHERRVGVVDSRPRPRSAKPPFGCLKLASPVCLKIHGAPRREEPSVTKAVVERSRCRSCRHHAAGAAGIE